MYSRGIRGCHRDTPDRHVQQRGVTVTPRQAQLHYSIGRQLCDARVKSRGRETQRTSSKTSITKLIIAMN